MHAEHVAAQEEPRTEQVNVRLTASEKADVRLVAAFDVRPESDVLREFGLAAVRARAAEIRALAAADAA